MSDHFEYFCFKKSFKSNTKDCLNLYQQLGIILENTYENFDIFAYLKKMRNLELLNEFLLNQEQNFFLNLISHRPYKIDLSTSQ